MDTLPIYRRQCHHTLNPSYLNLGEEEGDKYPGRNGILKIDSCFFKIYKSEI